MLSNLLKIWDVVKYPIVYLMGRKAGSDSAKHGVEKQNEKIRKIAKRRYNEVLQTNKKNNSRK